MSKCLRGRQNLNVSAFKSKGQTASTSACIREEEQRTAKKEIAPDGIEERNITSTKSEGQTEEDSRRLDDGKNIYVRSLCCQISPVAFQKERESQGRNRPF